MDPSWNGDRHLPGHYWLDGGRDVPGSGVHVALSSCRAVKQLS